MSTSRSNRVKGLAHPILLLLAVLVAVIGVAGFLLRSGGGPVRGSDPLFVVDRGGFEITIPAAGELAALQQIEIRNQLETRAIISEIVEEGTSVKAGDVLLSLNDEEIRTKIDDAIDEVNQAENALINARANHEISLKTRESELAVADLEVELAELALKAWEKGLLVSKRKELSLAKETAEKSYARLHERYLRSLDLEKKKYISTDDLKQDEIDMITARADLEQAELAIVVYENYEYHQERATNESAQTQAIDERERVEQRSDAEVRSAESDLRTAEHQYESAKARLEKLEQQLTYCTVTAPSDGLVVYASSMSEGRRGRNEGQPPQVGTELYRNEMVMALPDTSRMTAEVKVNEARSGLIEAGQAATIVSDALPDVVMSGQVLGVGVLAESGGWRDPNRRDYTVRILLHEDGVEGLKPSMRCKAEIAIGRVDDSLYVPIQAVFHEGGDALVYRPESGGFAQQRVAIGRASDIYVEVVDGLKPGDRVLMRAPRPQEITRKLEKAVEVAEPAVAQGPQGAGAAPETATP